MAKKKRNAFNLEFYGASELLKKIESAGGSVEDAVTRAVKESMVAPKNDLLEFIKKHHVSGLTEESFGETPFEWKNGALQYAVGFNMKKGGIAALFLDVGTPTMDAHFFIHNAMQKNLTKIRDAQEKALMDVFKELQ